MALLHVTWQQAQALGLRVLSLHVHHGLQRAADAWPDHIESECRRWAQAHPTFTPIECRVTHLRGKPARGQSVEEWARLERRHALIEMASASGVDLVLLAQHRGDQAETFLLQALRGAGPQGLAGMAPIQMVQGIRLARPWLRHPRSALMAVVREAGLQPVHDPSNDDPRWFRNRLRADVWPILKAAFPQAEAMLAEAARQSGRALATLQEGARADLIRVTGGRPDDRALQWDPQAWQDLDPARRAWVLRRWLAGQGIARPTAALIERVAQESVGVSAARWPVPGGGELRLYRGCLQWNPQADQTPPPAAVEMRWPRGGTRVVPGWGGCLVLRRAGIGERGWPGPLPLLCVVRERKGSDRFQRAPLTPPRSLKKQFQNAGVPVWERDVPVVCDTQGRLLMVPGLGMDARAAGSEGGWVLEWQPDGPCAEPFPRTARR